MPKRLIPLLLILFSPVPADATTPNSFRHSDGGQESNVAPNVDAADNSEESMNYALRVLNFLVAKQCAEQQIMFTAENVNEIGSKIQNDNIIKSIPQNRKDMYWSNVLGSYSSRPVNRQDCEYTARLLKSLYGDEAVPAPEKSPF